MVRIFYRDLLSVMMVFILSGCSSDNHPDKDQIVSGERISVLYYGRHLEQETHFLSEAFNFPPAYANKTWTQPGGEADNSSNRLALGKTVQEYLNIPFVQGSTRDIKIVAPPLIAEDRIFGLGADLHAVALDEATGRKVWKTNLRPSSVKNIKGIFGGGIAYWEGKIYATTGFGEIIALSAESGHIVWRVKTAIPYRNSPTVDDGRVFVVNHDNQLQVYHADTGQRLWEQSAISESATILSSSSSAVSGDIVVAGFSSGEILAMRVNNGHVSWFDNVKKVGRFTPLSELNPIISRPVIDRGDVFIISRGGRMVAIDLRSGERKWTKTITSIETPWVVGDYIYVVTIDSELICLSRREGKIYWVTQLQRYENKLRRNNIVQWRGPIFAGENLILVSSVGDMIFVSPTTGDILDSRKIGGSIHISPIVAHETIYILRDDGRLVIYR